MSLCIGNFYSGEIRRTYGNYAAKALHSIGSSYFVYRTEKSVFLSAAVIMSYIS